MKHLTAGLLLFFCLLQAPAQTSATRITANNPQDPFDLNRYLYSHTHYNNQPTDKPALDFSALDNWTDIASQRFNPAISPDGQYFAYAIQSINRQFKADSIVVQATGGPWRTAIAADKPGTFASDGKRYLLDDHKGLCIITTGTDERTYPDSIASYQLPSDDRKLWIATLKSNPTKTLLLTNLHTDRPEKRFTGVSAYAFDPSSQLLATLTTGKELIIYPLHKKGREQSFQNVEGYLFDDQGKALLLKTTNALSWVQLVQGSIPTTLWTTTDTATRLGSYTFDQAGNQVLFTTNHPTAGAAIWYWQTGMTTARRLAANDHPGIGPGLRITGSPIFTQPGNRYIQFTLEPLPHTLPLPPPAHAKVDIWNYKDLWLQDAQPALLGQPNTIRAILQPATGKVIPLEQTGRQLKYIFGDFALLAKPGIHTHGDRFWETGARYDSNWVAALENGRQYPLNAKNSQANIFFSPDGRYLVYFDATRGGHYFSYDLHNHREVNITAGLPPRQFNGQDRFLIPNGDKDITSAGGMALWLENGKQLLVYDNHDIWQLDPAGIRPPVCLTGGYGQKNDVVFTLAEGHRWLTTWGMSSTATRAARIAKNTLLLRAFNRATKHNGYYALPLDKPGKPTALVMGPFFFQQAGETLLITNGMAPLKATRADAWLLLRQTATEAPNYFITSDFKQLRQLTFHAPQAAYNWLTTELHNFPQLDGIATQGVLYKPENFDPNKKYPVLISFYGALSDRLFQFPHAQYFRKPNIFDMPAFLVSNGYLVFTPDIHFTQNQWGPSTVNAIEGAARYLATLPFVDSTHIGATGHSNSGIFGYYLLTHSRVFAAMAVGAATSNMIQAGLSVGAATGKSSLEWAENGMYGTSLGPLWDNKASWIDHTAVLHADRAQSPLLIFHNKKDNVPIAGATQMFTSLRRLEKPAWWLAYDGQGHILGGIQNYRDFTLRFTQYFDHYLKAAPPPRWMTQGIPYERKAHDTGFEPDTTNPCVTGCKSCNKGRAGQ